MPTAPPGTPRTRPSSPSKLDAALAEFCRHDLHSEPRWRLAAEALRKAAENGADLLPHRELIRTAMAETQQMPVLGPLCDAWVVDCLRRGDEHALRELFSAFRYPLQLSIKRYSDRASIQLLADAGLVGALADRAVSQPCGGNSADAPRAGRDSGGLNGCLRALPLAQRPSLLREVLHRVDLTPAHEAMQELLRHPATRVETAGLLFQLARAGEVTAFAHDALREGLDSDNSVLRERCAQALAHAGVAEPLFHSHPDVRRHALQGWSARADVELLLRDPVAEVREAALDRLLELPELAAGDPPVRGARNDAAPRAETPTAGDTGGTAARDAGASDTAARAPRAGASDTAATAPRDAGASDTAARDAGRRHAAEPDAEDAGPDEGGQTNLELAEYRFWQSGGDGVACRFCRTLPRRTDRPPAAFAPLDESGWRRCPRCATRYFLSYEEEREDMTVYQTTTLEREVLAQPLDLHHPARYRRTDAAYALPTPDLLRHPDPHVVSTVLARLPLEDLPVDDPRAAARLGAHWCATGDSQNMARGLEGAARQALLPLVWGEALSPALLEPHVQDHPAALAWLVQRGHHPETQLQRLEAMLHGVLKREALAALESVVEQWTPRGLDLRDPDARRLLKRAARFHDLRAFGPAMLEVGALDLLQEAFRRHPDPTLTEALGRHGAFPCLKLLAQGDHDLDPAREALLAHLEQGGDAELATAYAVWLRKRQRWPELERLLRAPADVSGAACRALAGHPLGPLRPVLEALRQHRHWWVREGAEEALSEETSPRPPRAGS